MVVMSDTEDPFVPLPGDLLVNLAESRAVVEALLDSLPTTFAGNTQVLLLQHRCYRLMCHLH
jgi:protein transport protein SEC24